jgi:xanthine dehydrogenase accessory factor
MTTSDVRVVGLAEVAQAMAAAAAQGRVGVAGRVVDIQGFSTWAGDEVVVVDENGTQYGWVLGEVGARRVGAASRDLLGRGRRELATVEVDVQGADVAEAGLSCGGRAELLLQSTEGIPSVLWARLAQRAPVALLTRIDGPGRSAQSMVVEADGTTLGRIGDDTRETVTEEEAVAVALRVMANGHSATRRVESETGTVLVEVWIPSPRLVVVGSGDLVGAISAQAGLLGWDTTAVEDRPTVSDESILEWPALDEALGWAGASAALVVLNHDPHVDVRALGAALDRAVPYIGAMGSQRTQSRRMARLRALGRSEIEIDRIRRPIGLDLGGRGAPEVALAICAEILAVHCGRDGRPLRDSDGPIHDRPVGPGAAATVSVRGDQRTLG